MKLITSLNEIPTNSNVVLKFGATWCGPCKKLKPIVEKLETEFPDITFLECDVDDAVELSKEYAIKAVPTMVFIKDNSVVEKVTGLQLTEPLRKSMQKLVG